MEDKQTAGYLQVIEEMGKESREEKSKETNKDRKQETETSKKERDKLRKEVEGYRLGSMWHPDIMFSVRVGTLLRLLNDVDKLVEEKMNAAPFAPLPSPIDFANRKSSLLKNNKGRDGDEK